ncbi:aminomethyl-transferring glycine dehydrogenase [Hydromonas duriensis]|uniref:Glycine dehydrogenase (decarboxylating) n=1 Tax=Hydromonas duriensis TaxID=1527608 RepID=A0A4R6YBX0_9BURK|nr:aminomethyl-transferring glycine dehydrogenase [Hydromonas duriensis]TDR33101.1 glycine dehydrogenase (decarboxylating) alpha subunit /glycine dehydrogenase (decarboxylating) beta subunit [Hydromonas duriensis]
MTSTTFPTRHTAPSTTDQAHMLKALGFESLDTFINAVVPDNIRRSDMTLGEFSSGFSEESALARLREHAAQNKVFKSFIGQGYYGTHTPAVILRNVLENPAWYTAYTPYQPEISQGRLEALLNFQQMVIDLTAMDIANASMLDEATAAAEAMTLAMRNSKLKSNVFYVSEDIFPQTLEVIQTRALPLNIEVRVVANIDESLTNDCFAVLVQYPAASGALMDYSALAQKAHEQGKAVIAASDLLALTQLKAPGEWGADIVIGNTQRFGVPFGFGGPHAAFMATRDAFKRSMPGRLVGVSVDAQGAPALRLALQTREQHIRRDKATSNICTAQALLAIMASMYAVYHGADGLKKIGARVHHMTSSIATALKSTGVSVVNGTWFDTLTLKVNDASALHQAAQAAGINLRAIDAEHVGLSVDETTTVADAQALLKLFGATWAPLDENTVPAALQRQSAFLTHPIFNTHHSEHAMLRYLRDLSDKDLALDRTMIPLGSCTMKLNATSEMLPVTWPEFSQIHPFAPNSQTVGYRAMIHEVEAMLVAATGYAAVSLQPNAGSQGEYAGLLIIQKYHSSRGQSHRNICLIPASAHGTNPASAAMVGMSVVVVACDERGNVDVADLKAKAEQHSDHLAALMITYPSTHGVFEKSITDICDIIHAHGGQVYVDGANMNAMVGLCAPGEFGGDVSHLNLHKTFAIPHGGGGPGVGPVCVAAHLAEFLPNLNAVGYQRDANGISAVSAAPYGSAGVLPITWMYIAMMGAAGLTEASKVAILSANYLAKRISEHFPILYTAESGLVAHECIVDVRGVKDTAGITVDDIAKRLMDFGFHAPTMSFPVPGTLMIEPTESEPLAELDRFIEAMATIRAEIAQVERGELSPEDNPLKHAPHTATVVCGNEWTHAYSREQAAFPVSSLRTRKYWPPVARVDNVYGDRNLFCACIPMSQYE